MDPEVRTIPDATQQNLAEQKLIEEGGFGAVIEALHGQGITEVYNHPLERWSQILQEGWASTPKGYFSQDVKAYTIGERGQVSERDRARFMEAMPALIGLQKQNPEAARNVLERRRQRALELAARALASTRLKINR